MGTLELTLSLPISYTALTIGKFLAVWTLCGVMLFSTIGLWISTALVTHTDNLGILQNYLICWLLCGALCAISLSASAFTAHPVSAFVVSLAVCLSFSLISFSSLVEHLGLSAEAILLQRSCCNNTKSSLSSLRVHAFVATAAAAIAFAGAGAASAAAGAAGSPNVAGF